MNTPVKINSDFNKDVYFLKKYQQSLIKSNLKDMKIPNYEEERRNFLLKKIEKKYLTPLK